MTATPLNRFDAREGQSLADHLAGVEAAATTLLDGAGTTPYGDDWATVIRTIAWTHDIGKLTPYFQEYLKTGDRSVAPQPALTYHSAFGALLTVRALASREVAPETIAAGTYAVLNHHSALGNARSDLRKYVPGKTAVDDRYQLATTQLNAIDRTAPDAANDVLERATDGAVDWQTISAEGLDPVKAAFNSLLDYARDEAFYGCALRAWSTLVAADKFDASGLATASDTTPATAPEELGPRQLTETVRDLSETQIGGERTAATYLADPMQSLPGRDATIEQRVAALRTAANARVTQALAPAIEAGSRVFDLTLPTGFGKTYTGLRAALTAAAEREGRVIYALPYTSIIDQLDDEVQSVFGVSPLDAAYTKHHHLADTRTITASGTDQDSPASGADTVHAEAWRSDLVVTTFTQLFESVAGPQNVQSMKLPALQDSVMILDEPQAISIEWWTLVGRLVTWLVDEYDAAVVLMTATQPRILRRLSDVPTPTPLVDDEISSSCRALLADEPRVRFSVHQSLVSHLNQSADTPPLSLADAATELTEAPRAGTNTLAVANTVGSVVSIATALHRRGWIDLGAELVQYRRESSGEFDPHAYLNGLARAHSGPGVVAGLTTRLRPTDRSALLSTLRLILDPTSETPFDDHSTVTVSTQLIEAGVDLSFDRLFRDYAPLPALVQAAGRCNRSFGGETAPVTLWRLDSPSADDYVPSQLIYGDRSLLRPTRRALDALRDAHATTELGEAVVVRDGVDRYYEALHEQLQTDERSDRLVDAFDNGDGETLRAASVVTNDYPTRDVLVPVTDNERATVDQYRAHRAAGEWPAARQAFQQLKHTLVTVPAASPTDRVESVDGERRSAYDVRGGRGVSSGSEADDTEI